MSDGHRVPFVVAREAASRICAYLDPVCRRTMIAGSVRRSMPSVGDIDLVVCPQRAPTLYGDGAMWSSEFIDRIRGYSQWSIESKVLNGETRVVKLRTHKVGMRVQLFCCTLDEFGCLAMIRTGPEEYSTAVVTLARETGWFFHRCRLYRGTTRPWETPDQAAERCEAVETLEECQVFDALGIEWVDPPQRARHRARRIG